MEVYNPEDAGMDAKRLDRIAPVMQGFVKDNQLPGIMTLVQRHGKVVHLGKFGLMDIEAGKPMQEDALFRIYSMTKPIISVAIMMLFEEGKLSLNDPVSKFIPAFKKTKVFAGAEVLGLKLVDQDPVMTVYHLLTHTSGLSYGWFFDSPVEDLYRAAFQRAKPDRNQLLSESVDRLAELPLLFQPGTCWRYSMAVDVLGLIIQVVADQPLADFLEERIFKPLGMVDTGFSVPAEKASRLAQIYTSAALYDPIPCKPDEVWGLGDVTTPTTIPSGGGGLISTLSDYLAFCTCLLNQGSYDGGRLINRKTLAWMTANHMPPSLMPIKAGPDTLDHGFGLGFRVTTSLGERRSLSSVGEYGWGGAAQTYFWIDPAEDFIGLMMTQHLPLAPYPVQERFRNLAYQAIAD
ncbi:MAG: serine hydrolase [Chloroflexi bacterium]|nr:serine hydrolase [Chloroflexota bacterium]